MPRRTKDTIFALLFCLSQGAWMAIYSDSGGNLTMVPLGFMVGVIAALMVRFLWLVLFVPLTLLAAISASQFLFGEGGDLTAPFVATILAASALGAAATVVVLHQRQCRAQTD